MSKIICVHSRNPPSKNLGDKLTTICKIIEPENIQANTPKVLTDFQFTAAIMNPMDTLSIHEGSVLLGSRIDDDNDSEWHRSGEEYPDGSYALFRNSDLFGEFVSDSVASRTIWYYFDQEVFIAATSQRALLLFLGNFAFDRRCIPWILSTGTLGPEYSWDKRIRRIPPATAIILDKKSWEIRSKTNAVKFRPAKRGYRENRKVLSNAISSTLKKMDLNLKHWVLPLSGGYDSRGILHFMLRGGTDPADIKTITWGLKESLGMKGNDAQVAQEVARTLKVPHKYYHTNLSNEPLKDILDRFILMGEGRIDHIGGYMDGFHIWKTLFEDGVQGIIRGDEGFGWANASYARNVRYSTGCPLCSDFTNLKDFCSLHGFPEQQMPQGLERRKEETISSWRDRLYHEYRLPTILAALSDLKLGYVEQTAPLLSDKILDVVRELPDELRTDKNLFKKIVDSMSPRMAYADTDANASMSNILQHEEVVEFLREELSTDHAQSILPTDFLLQVLENLKISDGEPASRKSRKQELIRFVKGHLPAFVKNSILSKKPFTVDSNLLAFRLYVIVFMHKIYSMKFEDLEYQR